MKITKTFSYKLLLNDEHKDMFSNILEATTFCYNLYLHYNKKYFEKNQLLIDLSPMLKQLVVFQKKYEVLRGVDNSYLNATIVDLFYSIKSIKNYEELPEFKTDEKKFIVLRNFEIKESENIIQIPVIGEIKYINSRKIKGNVKGIHFIQKQNDWFAYIILEQTAEKNNKKELRFLGIDVGLNDFAILSTGQKVNNPRFYRKMEEKLIKEQKSLSRKEKDSANWHKQLKKVRNVHQKIYHSRMNFLHQLTTFIVSEFDVIAVEKLAIHEMIQNRRLAKSIQDASWGIFIKMLKYKAKEKGKHIVEVNRYFPSTKTCSKCGNTEILPLHLRTFRCSKCNLHIHRDYNASLNLEQKAVHYAYTHNLLGSRG